jgi:uncharacterized protein (TIGR02391 family)
MQVNEEPIIKLTNLESNSDRNVQNGYKSIFTGSISAFRNPKAHANLNISKQEATHSIFVASKLMFRLDDSNY